MRFSGFTLVELMVAMAMVAILAALAVLSYSSYMNKAKAKDLITLAKACAQEALSECMVDEAGTVAWNKLEACSVNRTSFGPYISNATLIHPSSPTPCSELSSAGITACGYIKDIPAYYRVTCNFDAEKNLSCGLVLVSGCP